MKTILSEIVLIAGTSCIVIGAAALMFGSFQPSQPHSIAAIGLILVAAGAGKKKHWKLGK
jgi:hypothetical protein